VIAPILKFLDTTNSFFFTDGYTYFPWSQDPQETQGRDFTTRDPGSVLIYRILLYQMLDSQFFAMSKLGYSNIQLIYPKQDGQTPVT